MDLLISLIGSTFTLILLYCILRAIAILLFISCTLPRSLPRESLPTQSKHRTRLLFIIWITYLFILPVTVSLLSRH